MAAADLGTGEERSKITNQDLNLLKKPGITTKPKAPVIKDLLRIGAQFVGYREYANKAEEKLAEANDRANTLAQQLEQSEKARKKAESMLLMHEQRLIKPDAAGVEDLRKRLHTAETSPSDHIAAHLARRRSMPETLPALMDKFRDAPRIHGFVRAQLAAGARFAMIMIKICYPKLDVGQIVPKCLEKMSKRKRNFGKYDDIVTPVAEDMMDELLRMDSEFFVKGSYAE
ncbi:hypothetical protein QYE76_063947 [Lolium multiflorum]|uniref:Uncharacterized protein n=1 Tax=Lolium multiflorum TaxID=4521 RepID=A0AAD8W9S2_LOLMU|nr:hypothetical protein QYE76_063947 [Lolium multiflorum]